MFNTLASGRSAFLGGHERLDRTRGARRTGNGMEVVAAGGDDGIAVLRFKPIDQ